MEPIELIKLVSYAASLIACAVLAVYFLRKFLENKRLRAFLWWAAGFALFALGVLVMVVVALYGFHRVLVMLAFAVVAASVAFLYYAASLPFFDGKSFFREKFAVILFVVPFVLFLLPMYLFPEEHAARIVESPTMVLFVVTFLVIAVLFNHVVASFDRILRKVSKKEIETEVSKEKIARTLGALQSLVWIIPVWSLCIALFWGSVTAVGHVFVLSLFGFILLLYSCKPRKPRDRVKEKDKMPMWLEDLMGTE